MEKDGLIRKRKDLERKNLIRVEITEKGEEAYQRSIAMKVIPGILSCLSQKEHDSLRAYARRLRNKAVRELGIAYELPLP